MTTQLMPIIYPLDTTGLSINNKIVKEPHTLAVKRIRAIAPNNAPFYKDSVIVYDANSNDRVLATTEYTFFGLQEIASANIGKEIYGIILIHNSAVSNNVKVSYQTVGGEYTRDLSNTKKLLDILNNDSRSIAWPNIIEKPDAFNPSLHLHSIGDVTGFEYLVAAIERLIQTIRVKNSYALDELLEYVDEKLAIQYPITASPNQDPVDVIGFNNHIQNTNNPHQTTKAQVGLDLVQNYTTATMSDLTSPVQNAPKYVTNYVLSLYLIDYFNTLNTQLNNQINTLQTTVNNALNTANNAKTATTNISSYMQRVDTLESIINSNAYQPSVVNANLATAQTRASNLLQQYLNTGT